MPVSQETIMSKKLRDGAGRIGFSIASSDHLVKVIIMLKAAKLKDAQQFDWSAL